MAFANQLWGADTTEFSEKFVSVQDVMEQSGLNFRVESEPVYLADGTEVPKCKATRNMKTGDILGTVGDRYTILQNDEAFNWFQPFIDQKVAYMENVGTLKKGAITFVQAKVCTDPVEIIKGDAVESYITLLNSHTGLTSVFSGFFPRRIFCANQMPALKASHMLKVRHTKNVQVSMEKIQEIMNVATQEFVATTEQYRFLAAKGVNKSDLEKYVKLVFKKEAKSKADEEPEMRESTIEKITEYFENGRGASEQTRNMWGAFNAVNEYLNYEAGRTVDNRLQSLWIGANAQTNQKALETAVQLANGAIL